MLTSTSTIAWTFIALFFAGLTLASPASSLAIDTHRIYARGIHPPLTSYQPRSTFSTFGAGLDISSVARERRDSVNVTWDAMAVQFVQSKLSESSKSGDELAAGSATNFSVAYRTGYVGQISKHAFVAQYFNDIPVANAVANVALNHNDQVTAYGSSLLANPTRIASSTPTITKNRAISIATAILSGSNPRLNLDSTVNLTYFATDNDALVLTWAVQVESDQNTDGTLESEFMEVFVDAQSGEVVNIFNFMAHATFRAVPFNTQDPGNNSKGLQTLINPEDLVSSPKGWNTVGGSIQPSTHGNNVIAFQGQAITPATSSTGDLQFLYTQNPSLNPDQGENIDVAVVNAFVAGNFVHDLAYKYGFTEAAFNFQAENNGKGGRGNDAVLLSVQDASGVNNANFATPPDGQPGRCNMFKWTLTTPNRDGALENDIVVHEFTHGITSRMTGGGTGRCLSTLESGGLGEGWSDTMAFVTEQTSSKFTNFVVGAFVSNKTKGIRNFPYSLDVSVNPLVFSDVPGFKDVHPIGEVWAMMLIEVYATLVSVHGFAENIFNPDQTEGNVVFLHLMIDALALQPCNPTFLTARDAILQADTNRYNGTNQCNISAAFAKRGLGSKAVNFEDDDTLPNACAGSAALEGKVMISNALRVGRSSITLLVIVVLGVVSGLHG